jgi:hypothetical protein
MQGVAKKQKLVLVYAIARHQDTDAQVQNARWCSATTSHQGQKRFQIRASAATFSYSKLVGARSRLHRRLDSESKLICRIFRTLQDLRTFNLCTAPKLKFDIFNNICKTAATFLAN